MSFLTPLFLLGGLAIAGPILFHLIRRNTRRRFTFSSLMFLRPEPPRVTRKSRLEDIPLLIARCILLGLLVLAFARPFFRELVEPSPGDGDVRRSLLLVDVSASMRRGGLWDKAVAKAMEVIDQTKPEEMFSIIAFGDDAKTVLGVDQWKAAPVDKRLDFARDVIRELEPGWAGTDLGGVLLSTSRKLEEEESSIPSQIHLLTDLQEGLGLGGLQGHEWPEGISIHLERLAPDVLGNAGLQLLARANEDSNGSSTLRVRISNSSDSTQESFRLAWVNSGEFNSSSVYDVYLPAGHTRTLSAPPRPIGRGYELTLLDDVQGFDDRLHVVPEEPELVRVRYVGSEAATDIGQMQFYLEQVFSQTRLLHVDLLALNPTEFSSEPRIPSDSLLIITEPLPPPALVRARDFCSSGKPVLLVLKDLRLATNLAALTGRSSLPVSEATVDEYSLLTQPDFEHPLLAPFEGPGFGDFTKIHFWKHRFFNPDHVTGCDVLLRFDDGSPALLDLKIGSGNLLVLTSGWHPKDSQLALSSKFVPLLYSMMGLGRSTSQVNASCIVGRPVDLPAERGGVISIEGPSGASTLSRDEKFFHVREPGVYTLQLTKPVSFAANLPPAESKTTPLPEEVLEGLELPLFSNATAKASNFAERRQALLDEELEKRQKTWRWLIFGAILFALIETWLAGRAWRQPFLLSKKEEPA